MKKLFAPAQIKYMEAKAMHETIKKLEKQAKVKILRENLFYTKLIEEEIALGEKVERILDPISDFRMSEEDFITYCKLTHAEYIRLGINVPDYNTTADHKSRKDLRNAQKELLEWGHNQVKKLPQYKNCQKEIQNLFARANELRAEQLEELINLTLKVAV